MLCVIPDFMQAVIKPMRDGLHQAYVKTKVEDRRKAKIPEPVWHSDVEDFLVVRRPGEDDDDLDNSGQW